jgi:hypothetical protein
MTLSLLLVLGLVPPAESAVVTIPSVRDNTLFQDAEGDTSNGAGPAMFAGRNSQNLTRRALVAFDLSGHVPAGALIESVVLTLEVTSAPDTLSRQFTLHRVLADWGEGLSSTAGGSGAPAAAGDATWLHTFYPGQFWSSPGGDFDPTPSGTETVGDVGTYCWTGAGMVADVQHWLDHPDINFGWLVRGEESGPRTVRRFDSRESDLPPNRPSLSISYTLPVATRPVSWSALKAIYR